MSTVEYELEYLSRLCIFHTFCSPCHLHVLHVHKLEHVQCLCEMTDYTALFVLFLIDHKYINFANYILYLISRDHLVMFNKCFYCFFLFMCECKTCQHANKQTNKQKLSV